VGALAVAVILSIALGAAAAVTRNRFLEHTVTGVAVTAVTLPNFLVGIVFILVFALQLRLFPASGYVPFLTDPLGNLRVMTLPVLTLGLGYIGSLTLILNASIRHVRRELYIQTARAKGLPGSRVLWRHVLKNSLIPFITNLGLSAARLFGGAVVTETVFALPGMGRLLVDSLLSRDFPTFQALLVVMTFGVLSMNLVMDIAYGLLDPRITYE
jgi:peptide/nickel transport system permease protein